ncbi:MAG TPA: acid phosphatase [Stellaceae bacterium]|nr:acid phosphatase [Stellaceae bacterium]
MRRLLTLIGLTLTACTVASSPHGAASPGLTKLDHIVVVYLENRSFDNLFGEFPGANGLRNAGTKATQVDLAGKPYATLPPVMDTAKTPPVPDERFPRNLPNKPFLIDQYIGLEDKDPNLTHLWYQQQAQIDGGRMDKFAAISNAGGLVMGYHDGSKTKLWQYAKEFTLADNFFHAAFGGSFLNHFWTICACTPVFPNAPADVVAKEAADGGMIKDGEVTPDGYAVNTLFSVYAPHPAKANTAKLLPPQTLPTIGDRLSEAGVSWTWYSGGWNAALAGNFSHAFQFHHQPFAYFKNYGDGTAARRQHLKDEADLVADIGKGVLPAVVFYKPVGEENEHPGYANVTAGDEKITAIIERIRHSPLWARTAIIVTYDENGGFWDHVAPPKLDRWGPGVRVPTVIISPWAKRGFVDHSLYDTTSILKLIEERFGLRPLAERDARANGLDNAFDFTRP